MLKTPGMRRRAKLIEEVVERVLNVHTPAQRAGCPRDLADDLLNMHSADRQFLPESNLRFVLSAPLLASMYMGDELSFVIYSMLARPEFHEKIRAEADALFADGDPDADTVTGQSIDVTRRFIMEVLRLYPIVIAEVTPNCWIPSSEENTRTPNPNAVVSAEPSSAEPVVARVRTAAFSGLRTRANSSW